ncbi:transposase [Candidatus Falkowbacteria bacterium CG10_big_fil_rev_8_21_14_0_10_43_10]|uniref:Transposase n=1 Tax=Candidatus Falkowbacteria bacterium CG10_big_fil_rev_8_21_14_0_10_43_10 TaxID=1974567 RepID=A0A2H0V312_9BACT|nr:MAG: transposase [Candidatus Falkowbacteria bacterium CG10_big_fil_rev_8_21_14_0_10_43_10]
MTLYKECYRVETTRHPGWNYADDGMYFITICTNKRREYFGQVVSEKMYLNNIGQIVVNEWLKTPKIRKNVMLDEWIIMPNHFHGILFICNDNVETPRWGVSIKCDVVDTVKTPRCGVSGRYGITHNYTAETPHRGVSTKRGGYNPKWQANSLGSIINQFKSVCTKRIRKISPNFTWQPRFYDHIIRNEYSLQNIRNYIYNNPLKWEIDRNNPENLWM